VRKELGPNTEIKLAALTGLTGEIGKIFNISKILKIFPELYSRLFSSKASQEFCRYEETFKEVQFLKMVYKK
jgi:hypothetical protein